MDCRDRRSAVRARAYVLWYRRAFSSFSWPGHAECIRPRHHGRRKSCLPLHASLGNLSLGSKLLTVQSLRNRLLFRGALKDRAREWNWHNVIGIWAAVPLFFIVLT